MRASLLDDSSDNAASPPQQQRPDSGSGLSKYLSSTSPPPISRRTFTLLLVLVSLMAVTILALALWIVREERGRAPTGGGGGGGGYIGSGVEQADLWRHLTALQNIADSNGGTRAIGHVGFNATVAYIRSVLLNETDYDVLQQPFVTSAWYQGPPSISLSIGADTNHWRYQTDFHVLTYSGSVSTTAAPVFAVGSFGCAADDYSAVNFTRGAVALIPAGQCSNGAKTSMAAAQGAVAVLVYQSRATRTFLPGGVAEGSTIGAFLILYETGVSLAEAVYGRQGSVTAAMNLSTSIAPTGVSNVCATTRFGDKRNTIVSGSHCDSVPAGAGVSRTAPQCAPRSRATVHLPTASLQPALVAHLSRIQVSSLTAAAAVVCGVSCCVV